MHRSNLRLQGIINSLVAHEPVLASKNLAHHDDLEGLAATAARITNFDMSCTKLTDKSAFELLLRWHGYEVRERSSHNQIDQLVM